MMGSTALTTSTATDLTVVRRQLLAGKLTGARHALCILSDEGANDDAFYIAKSVVSFFEGDKDEAAKLIWKVQSIGRSHSHELEQLYGQLLVEGAICKSLMRDTRADLVDTALEQAATLLMKHRLYSQADATTYVEILDLIATDKIDRALELHREMARLWNWEYRSDHVLQEWKTPLDLAMLRALCKQTKAARRVMSLRRNGGSQYKYEDYAVDVWFDILDSNASKRTKVTATRLIVVGCF